MLCRVARQSQFRLIASCETTPFKSSPIVLSHECHPVHSAHVCPDRTFVGKLIGQPSGGASIACLTRLQTSSTGLVFGKG